MTFDGTPTSWNTVYDSSDVNVIFQTSKNTWGTGYNNLNNVAYGDSGGKLIIDFVSLGGATITLNSFDLGNYLGNGTAVAYQVFDLADTLTPLLNLSTLVVYSNLAHPTFNIGLSSTAGLRLALGPDIYNNAVDNISFLATPSAGVPEPTALSLAGLVLGLLAFSTRSRRRAR